MPGVRLLVLINPRRELAVSGGARLFHIPAYAFHPKGRASRYSQRGVADVARLRVKRVAVGARWLNRAPEQRHAPDAPEACAL
jgi:hypothetical protein